MYKCFHDKISTWTDFNERIGSEVVAEFAPIFVTGTFARKRTTICIKKTVEYVAAALLRRNK